MKFWYVIPFALLVGCADERPDPRLRATGFDPDAPPRASAPREPEPLRELELQAVTEEDLGLEFYPGSVEHESSAKIESSEGVQVWSVRKTPATLRDVAAFYEPKLERGNTTTTPTTVLVTGKGTGGLDYVITASRDEKRKTTTIAIAVSKPRR